MSCLRKHRRKRSKPFSSETLALLLPEPVEGGRSGNGVEKSDDEDSEDEIGSSDEEDL